MRFNLFGFPVEVKNEFWFLVGILGLIQVQGNSQALPMVVIWAAICFVSILWHELGHTFFQRRYGANAMIVLHSMGGLAIPDRGATRWQNLTISLMGPIFGLLLGGWTWILVRQFGPFEGALAVFAIKSLLWVNIGWSLLNLLPMLPLDGGHVLASLLGPKRMPTVCLVGMIIGGAVCIWCLTRGMFFNALLAGSIAFQNFQAWRQLQHRQPVPRPEGDSPVIPRNREDPDWWKRDSSARAGDRE